MKKQTIKKRELGKSMFLLNQLKSKNLVKQVGNMRLK